jgi:uncharacterized membrane protein YfcA
MDVAPWWYGVLFASGLLAGWVDSIAGGGGLITIPVLLGLGLSPRVALGTNKLQASFGSFTAARHYLGKGVVSLEQARPGILWTILGTCAGTGAIQLIHQDILGGLIPILLLLIAIYMLVAPAASDHDAPPRMGRVSFFVLFGMALGFYDGFFGPGVGSFWAFAFIALQGFNLKKATGYTKVMNFTSNVVSCALFLGAGDVLVVPALSMAAGQIIGARVGSGMVVSRGTKFIRPIFITVVILTTLKLLYDHFS